MSRPLTPRQRNVLRLRCLGLSGAEVARELGIDRNVARSAELAVLDKTGVQHVYDLRPRLAELLA